MKFFEVFYRVPFLPVFAFSYIGILLSDKNLLVVISVCLVCFVILIFLKLYDFLPLVLLTLIFFFYTKGFSKIGNLIVGRVDSISSSSILVSVEYVKKDVDDNWERSGGYIRVFGTEKLGEFDVYDRLIIYCSYVSELRPGWSMCSKPKFIEKTDLKFFLKFLRSLREKARGIVRGDDDQSKILDSILFGGREDLDQRFLYELSKFGILHMIAISGSHFTAVAFLGVFLSNLLGFLIFRNIDSVRFQPYLFKIFLSFLLQLLFLFMCGMVRPAQRAFIMNTVFFTVYLSGRSGSLLNALFISSFLIILINPFDVWNISFVLSFVAVLFIILFTPTHSKIGTIFWASVFASLGVLPVSLWLGIPVSLVAPLTNVIFTSLFNLVIIFGVAGVFAGFVFQPLSEIPIALAKFFITLIIYLVDIFGYLGIALSSKVSFPYEVLVLLFVLGLLILKRFRFFLHMSIILYLLVPTLVHLITREKTYTLSVFLVKEVRSIEGKEFYIQQIRENISVDHIKKLEDFLKKEKARCSVMCYAENSQIGDIDLCENYRNCDFGDIRN
ncbi:MAG: ComEC/Rec2 family competence protein [Candidatus Calescibacterium sp.]|nr:ComEC/Rec2 family competence protein [Candidatus Calescibacterium sp.]MDW8087323.1 ComEC/Rec2 family competence protein [Candidatus Calescibacterium sp.]